MPSPHSAHRRFLLARFTPVLLAFLFQVGLIGMLKGYGLSTSEVSRIAMILGSFPWIIGFRLSFRVRRSDFR